MSTPQQTNTSEQASSANKKKRSRKKKSTSSAGAPREGGAQDLVNAVAAAVDTPATTTQSTSSTTKSSKSTGNTSNGVAPAADIPPATSTQSTKNSKSTANTVKSAQSASGKNTTAKSPSRSGKSKSKPAPSSPSKKSYANAAGATPPSPSSTASMKDSLDSLIDASGSSSSNGKSVFSASDTSSIEEVRNKAVAALVSVSVGATVKDIDELLRAIDAAQKAGADQNLINNARAQFISLIKLKVLDEEAKADAISTILQISVAASVNDIERFSNALETAQKFDIDRNLINNAQAQLASLIKFKLKHDEARANAAAALVSASVGATVDSISELAQAIDNAQRHEVDQNLIVNALLQLASLNSMKAINDSAKAGAVSSLITISLTADVRKINQLSRAIEIAQEYGADENLISNARAQLASLQMMKSSRGNVGHGRFQTSEEKKRNKSEQTPVTTSGMTTLGSVSNSSSLLSTRPPAEEDKDNWSKRSTVNTESILDNTSVLSETEALGIGLEDPIVAASRSMSVEEPLDAFAEALAKGIETEVHGLVIPYGWTWCHEGPVLRAYTSLAEEIHALEADTEFANRCCYVYAPSELHCTVATLSSFKESESFFSTMHTNNGKSPEEVDAVRRTVMGLWKDAIERRFVAPSSPPQAVVERIEVAESAIIFHLKPLDNTMERMRAAVRAAAEDVSFREFEINNGLSPYELTRLIHIPNISHSTFVRFRKRPSPQLRARLEEVVSRWTPNTVTMFGMKLVYENRPYMHIDMEKTIVMRIDGQEEKTTATTSTEATSKEAAASEHVADVDREQKKVPASRAESLSSGPSSGRGSGNNTFSQPKVSCTASSKKASAGENTPAHKSPLTDDDGGKGGGSSGQNYLVMGLAVATIAAVVAMVLARRK